MLLIACRSQDLFRVSCILYCFISCVNLFNMQTFIDWLAMYQIPSQVLRIWCWLRQSSNTLDTWCKELTHWKRPWCWGGLKAGGKGNDTGWDRWMACPTWWTWSLSKLQQIVKDREAWRASVHGVTKSRTWLSDWTELNHSDGRKQRGTKEPLDEGEEGEWKGWLKTQY